MDSLLIASAAKPTCPQPDDIEDQHGAYQLPDRWALIVCDGASSSRHAQEAVRLTCDRFIEVITQSSAAEPAVWSDRVKQALLQSHRQILQHFPQGDALTTAAAAVILPEESQLLVATVGDSPAYYVH